MKIYTALLIAPFMLSACSNVTQPFRSAPEPAVAPAPRAPSPQVASPAIGGAGQSAATLDTTTAQERAEATAPVAGGAKLGITIASLGDPQEKGFWLKTPLVRAETRGRLEAADGSSVNVTLLPLDGAASSGSRISLSAMRALGLGLTDLAPLSVFRSESV